MSSSSHPPAREPDPVPARGRTGEAAPSADERSFRLREARAEDAGAICAVTLAAYAELAEVMAPTAWEGLDRAVRSALASEERGVSRFVAERAGRVVGSVMLYPAAVDAYGGVVAPAEWPELRLLAVLPEVRGEGIGEALVEACIEQARADGATSIGLHTSESLAAARRMYARMGFSRVPAHDFQPEGGELVLAYRLRI